MQGHKKSKKSGIKSILFFVLVLLLAYLPVCSFWFFLKNDAFNGYFPSRFFISESLDAGRTPWWNPYINFGLPQYGDMNSGFWNPITWLIASTVGYNAFSFTIELLFYLLTAGTGMYFLCKHYKLSGTVSFIAGTAFMCCGYMVGHLQHFNWISGAAFLPWCLWAFNQLQKRSSLKNIILAANLFYLLVSSAHPGIIIGSIYFFTALIIYSYFRNKNGNTTSTAIRKYARHNLIFIALFLVISAGMITGYLDILPHITRGEKVATAAMTHPVSLQSGISALLPLSIVKNDSFFNTDLSMRNIYMGLTMLLFLFTAITGYKNNDQRFFLYAGLFFFLLSLGGIINSISYNIFPLMAYVRLNGEFAIFALLGFILTAAISLDRYIRAKPSFTGSLQKTYFIFQLLLIAGVSIGLVMTIVQQSGFIFRLSESFSKPGLSEKLKSLVDSISFYDALWLQGILQLYFLHKIKQALSKGHRHLLLKLCMAELILATLLNIPFTGVGKASVIDVQMVLRKAPERLPRPDMEPVGTHSLLTDDEAGLVGNWSFYNKQIGTAKYAFYPVELKNTKKVFRDSISIFAHKPCLFTLKDSTTNEINITAFTGNIISITLDAKNADSIIYQQNSYPGWICLANGSAFKAYKEGDLFLSAPIKPGRNYISFIFKPGIVSTARRISLIVMGLSLVVLVALYFKRPYL